MFPYKNITKYHQALALNRTCLGVFQENGGLHTNGVIEQIQFARALQTPQGIRRPDRDTFFFSKIFGPFNTVRKKKPSGLLENDINNDFKNEIS